MKFLFNICNIKNFILLNSIFHLIYIFLISYLIFNLMVILIIFTFLKFQLIHFQLFYIEPNNNYILNKYYHH